MDYVFLIATILASIYTFTYARWLQNNGNKVGALGMYVMIMGGIALAAYRVL